MDTMERDPQYIAEQVKFLRKTYRLTQENLADAAGLTTRTIEKIESGRHRPDEQTLRSIARAVGLSDIKFFAKPSPEEQVRFRANVERASRKMVLASTTVIKTASDFLHAFGRAEMFRIDTSEVTGDEAVEIAATMSDQVRDLIDIWSESSEVDRLLYARSFVEDCKQLEDIGYLCHMGRHRQRMRDEGKPDLVFTAGFLSIRPTKDSSQQRYALVQLEGRWETLEEDRPSMLKTQESL